MTFWNRAKEELRKWIITLTGVACFGMLQTIVSDPLTEIEYDNQIIPEKVEKI